MLQGLPERLAHEPKYVDSRTIVALKIARIVHLRDRQREAVSVLQQAIDAQRGSRLPPHSDPAIMLPQILV